MYTSLKLSKLLQENGFKGKGEFFYIDKDNGILINKYDILNDLCVKYYKELFPTTYPKDIWIDEIVDNENTPSFFGEYITIRILSLLQQNKQDEAELYLFENCLFNPKNK